MSAFSEGFEKVSFIRITIFLDRHQLPVKPIRVPEWQIIDRRRSDAFSCTYNIKSVEGRETSLGVILDVSKAFDCGDHKLKNYGVGGVPLK